MQGVACEGKGKICVVERRAVSGEVRRVVLEGKCDRKDQGGEGSGEEG